ncbi:ChaN family lipoprotein [Leptolyngbya sp. PCC 6406]|uniref:ChaN family lipoprotein n=1 Tax=Leptolyngbya sp. PCC 6406 TaxID=1173264 RepID=UPI0002AC175B|nr:ChaN family lipoprotein [Leptolyngbya sp. PCC 6406]
MPDRLTIVLSRCCSCSLGIAIVPLGWSLTIATFTLLPFPALAETPPLLSPTAELFQTATGSQVDFPALITALTAADIVYLGEIHDNPGDHQAQLAILQALHGQNPKIAMVGDQPKVAIAMEMFQQPYQPVLDAYLAGEITLAELRQQSDYDQRWGYAWDDYAPILEFARQEGVPLIALNAPSEAVRLVARQGLQALNSQDFPTLPPLSSIDLSNQSYRDLLRRLYDDMHQGHGSSAGFDFFFQAQVLWDETMADRIAQFHTDHPDTQVVVLAGQGHIIYGYGIPDRLQRRHPDISQATVLLSPATGWPAGEGVRADWEGVINRR